MNRELEQCSRKGWYFRQENELISIYSRRKVISAAQDFMFGIKGRSSRNSGGSMGKNVLTLMELLKNHGEMYEILLL